jgi:hypothetical protein
MRFKPFLLFASFTFCVASVAAAQDEDPQRDLVKLGQSLLPTDDVPRVDAGKSAGGSAAADASASAAAVATNVDASSVGAEDAGVDAATAGAGTSDSASTPTPTREADRPESADAGSMARDAVANTESPRNVPAPRGGFGPSARRARIESGQNSELKSVEASPIAALGVPAQAVPIVATTAAVGTLALWPFLLKTIGGLLKTILAGLIKNRAKQGKKIEKNQRVVQLLGFSLRPVELAALLLGALIYGLAVGYAFQGWRLSPSFLFSQEALVVFIYYARSFIRFGFERRYNLPTQFKLWIGGGLLCLVSSYLGTTLGTVGYELEEGSSKEDTDRIVRLKATLIGVTFALALMFFVANVVHPMKIFQSGRVMLSGMALAEILPITPMPGKRIYGWKKGVWAVLAASIIPSFVLINYVL